MKICILTQPLKFNYGGILQAYALQKVLKQMGHSPITLNYDKPYKLTKKTILKRIIAKLILGKRISVFGRIAFPELNKHLMRFVSENIDCSELIYAPLSYDHIKKYDFDAFIVGSDQVWRKAYSPYLPTFFLDFLTDKENVKKLAYASSFGIPSFDVNKDELNTYASLIKQFDAISVREKDAIDIVKNDLKSNATQVLDPTMLIDSSEYIKLIEKDLAQNETKTSPKQCFGYILDVSDKKKGILENIANKYGLSAKMLSIQQFPPKDFNLESCIQPAVTEWLSMIKNADFVVTDSFHGTVFSILFNVPFAVVANNGRGISRFNTLLETFNLQNRMILSDDPSSLEKLYQSNIDWDAVNATLIQQREKSKKFLSDALQ